LSAFIINNPPNAKGTGLASGSAHGARTSGNASASVRTKV
jgi:hypothetical protein